MPQLDPAWFASQLFWLVALFTLLYVSLRAIALPPLLDVLEDRADTLSFDLEQAQSIKDQAEAARVAYETALATSRNKAQASIAEVMQLARKRSEIANAELDRQLHSKLSLATEDLTRRKQEAMEDLTPAATELASLIVGRLIKAEPSAADAKKAVTAADKKGA